MRALFVQRLLTGGAVFVILWDAKATVPLGTALSNVLGRRTEAVLQASQGSVETSVTTSKPEQGRGPRGEHTARTPARKAHHPPSHLPRTTPAPRASRRRDERVAYRNGHEARATSLQIKRLLLSSAKCAA